MVSNLKLLNSDGNDKITAPHKPSRSQSGLGRPANGYCWPPFSWSHKTTAVNVIDRKEPTILLQPRAREAALCRLARVARTATTNCKVTIGEIPPPPVKLLMPASAAFSELRL